MFSFYSKVLCYQISYVLDYWKLLWISIIFHEILHVTDSDKINIVHRQDEKFCEKNRNFFINKKMLFSNKLCFFQSSSMSLYCFRHIYKKILIESSRNVWTMYIVKNFIPQFDPKTNKPLLEQNCSINPDEFKMLLNIIYE